MPRELKTFSGIMDTDNSEYVVAPSFHTYAKNVVFRGNQNNLRVQNILGTRQLNYTLPTGTARCIGVYYDAKKQRVFFFLYASSTNNGIYILDTNTQTVTPLIKSNTSTNGDVLGFTLTKTIYNINIIYGDALQGDALYWLDSLKRPSYINIDKQLAGSYGTVERKYIDVIKPPSDAPPYCIYENDNTVTVNNLRKKLFTFKTRPVYLDNTKGVWSSHSAIPIPDDYSDADVDADASKNSRIAMVIQTGDKSVIRYEVAAAENLGTVFSDFYLVRVFDKAKEGIADNDIIIYRFFNDQAYTYIDLTDSVQEFDWIPQEADSQELLNGNTLIYGNDKEGYDLTALTATATTSNDIITNVDYDNVLFNVAQQGESGFQTGNIHAVVLGAIKVGNVFTIKTTNQIITFTATATTTSNVIAGLSAAAVVAGFTVVSSDTENLVISKNAEALQLFNTNLTGHNVAENFVYDWFSRYGFGVVYFDSKGRTNGVVYTSGLTVQTPTYAENGSTDELFPYISLSITSRPPIWAAYYHIVRTKNLSKSKFIYWITAQTFKDDTYAYLSIENLNQYIKDNPSASFLAYDFTPNDRIKIIKLYPSGAFTTPIIYPSLSAGNKDYTIVTSVINPIINGAQQFGQFIKILLPTTDAFFDFGIQSLFGVPADFSHYFIQLYTPAQSVANGLDLYYEFGEKYAIGNVGTVNAFHQGMLQNQTSNLVTPATFKLVKGDDYVKFRYIYASNELKYTLIDGDVGEGDFVPMDLDKPFDTAGYTTQAPIAQHLSGNLKDSSNWMINVTDGNAYTFNIKGSIVVKAVNNSTDSFGYNFTVTNSAGSVSAQDAFTVIAPVAGRQYVFNVNLTVMMPAGSLKLFLIGRSGPSLDAVFHSVSGSLTITDNNATFPEYVIDQNFSDFFQSSINSNGRAWVYDSNARQSTFGNLHRWGLNYEPDTNINRSNRFYGSNFIESDLSKGDILRYKTRGQELRMFFTRGVGTTGIYAKYIQDNSGNNQLITTDDILTQNNINYFLGEHGLGAQPTGLVSSASEDYFIDTVTGDHMRVAPNGMQSISNLYWGKYYLRSLFTPYNKTWARTDGSNAKIFGCYNFLESQCIMLLQSGTNGGNSINDYAFSFNEQRNGYDTFYDFHPEMIVCAETTIYSWLNGNLYVHDNANAYNNFYGVQYNSNLNLIFNRDIQIRKKYGAIGYQSNQIWVSDTNGDIKTSFINPQTNLQQISQLKSVDYALEENIRTAAFLFDANSGLNPAIALLEGDFLSGNWLSLNLIYKGSEFSYLYMPYITWSISQKNL